MAKVQIWEPVQDLAGNAITGADVYVYDARTTNEASVVDAETAGAPLPQPLAVVNGTIPGWVDEGEYDLHVYVNEDLVATRRFNAVRGGSPKLGEGSVVTATIAEDAVDTSKLAPEVRERLSRVDSYKAHVINDQVTADSGPPVTLFSVSTGWNGSAAAVVTAVLSLTDVQGDPWKVTIRNDSGSAVREFSGSSTGDHTFDFTWALPASAGGVVVELETTATSTSIGGAVLTVKSEFVEYA